MINTSSEFKRLIYSGERVFVVDATITLANGTTLNVSNSRIMSNGLEIDDAVGSDGDFDCMGSTIVNGCELILYNNDEIYSDYDFINAKVNIVVKVMTSHGYETVPKGVFTVDEATFSNMSVTLTLLDNMCQFDRPYKSQNLYTNSTTIYNIVMDACTSCGVLFSQSTIPNGSFIVNTPPKEDTTYRDVIGWCAAIAGCFARCTTDGKLEFAWFDTDRFDADTGTDGGIFDAGTPSYTTGDTLNGGTFNPWNDPINADGGLFTDRSGLHHITSLNSQNIGVDDVVITGVKVEYEVEEDNKVETKTYPTNIANDAYVITISSIPFINADNVETFYNTLAARLIGLRFRTCNVTHTADPTIEAGDVAWLWDTKGEKHRILITRSTFSPANLQTIVCGAKTPSRNGATQMTALSRAEARSNRRLNTEKSLRQLLVEDLENKIANSSGLYVTEVPKSGGSDIYYHNLPELNESDIRILISEAGITVTPNGTDQNPTWYGLTVDGNFIANILSAIGIDADWINTGSIVVKKGNNTTFSANVDTGEVIIVADSFSLSNGDTINSIASTAASTAVNGQTQQSIFNKLTNNGQTQGIYLSNGKIYLNGTYIQAGTITIKKGTQTTFSANADTGVVNIVADNFSLSNGDTINSIASSAATTAVNGQTQQSIFNKLTNNGQTQGIYLSSGKIYINGEYLKANSVSADVINGGTLTLGGNANVNGVLNVKNASGTTIGTWDKDGLNATGKITLKDGNRYAGIGSVSYSEYNEVTGSPVWKKKSGFAIQLLSGQSEVQIGDNIISQYGIFTDSTQVLEQVFASNKWVKQIMLGSYSSAPLMEMEYSNNTFWFTRSGGSESWSPIYIKIGKSSGIKVSTDSGQGVYIDCNNTYCRIGNYDNFSFTCRSTGGFLAYGGSSYKISVESSSSRRYKHAINYELTGDRDYHNLLNLPIAEFVFNDDHGTQYADMKGKTIPGIIAEDVEEIYPSATIHNEEGEVESWDERRIIPGMLALIQEQHKKIESLEDRVAKLENLVEELLNAKTKV